MKYLSIKFMEKKAKTEDLLALNKAKMAYF